MKALLVALAAAIALSGCGVRPDQSSPSPQASPTASAEVFEQLTYMQAVWDGQTNEGKAYFCGLFHKNREEFLDAFMEGAGPRFDRQVTDFFYNERCK